jgi:hypothetical protein
MLEDVVTQLLDRLIGSEDRAFPAASRLASGDILPLDDGPRTSAPEKAPSTFRAFRSLGL